MKLHWLRWSLTFSLGLMITSCANDKPAPVFSGESAFEYLAKQVDFGPRVPGTDAWRKCRTYYYDLFHNLGLSVDSQAFDFTDPYSERQIPLVNVIARIIGTDSASSGILLMAHYDSRPRTDFPSKPELANEPQAGANDGASGVAVLLELANLMSQTRPPKNVDLVLVDGEDWGQSGDNEYYLLGSREFARRGIRHKYQYALVIDMIGDSDQQIYRESFSHSYHPELNEMVWGAAKVLGITTFVDSTVHIVLDDHVSLATSGVPAIDIIDFDYRYWHTDSDLVSKCSAASLENVGRVLTHICYSPVLWPKEK